MTTPSSRLQLALHVQTLLAPDGQGVAYREGAWALIDTDGQVMRRQVDLVDLLAFARSCRPSELN